MFPVVPEEASLDGVREKVANMSQAETLALAQSCIDHVSSHINIEQLVLAAACDPWNQTSIFPAATSSASAAASSASAASSSVVQAQKPLKRSREDVEAAAAKKGARGG